MIETNIYHISQLTIFCPDYAKNMQQTPPNTPIYADKCGRDL